MLTCDGVIDESATLTRLHNVSADCAYPKVCTVVIYL